MPDMAGVAKQERLRRIKRVLRPRVLRALFHGVTDPENDAVWDLLARRGRKAYFENPVPWFAPDATNFLESRLHSGVRIFEWGSGSSTLWFQEHGCEIVSLETDPGWAEWISQRARERTEIRLVGTDDESYTNPADDLTSFDIVVVDGERRVDCGLHSASALKSSGSPTLVVVDDSNRAAYRPALDALSGAASGQWHFAGLNTVLTPHMTSIYEITPR